MRLLALLLALTLPGMAYAKGFLTRDLSGLVPAMTQALGKDYQGKMHDGKIVLHCPECAAEPIISIEPGRQTDGTEGRVRSGATKIADLEKQCQAREPQCRIAALDGGPAVGWVSAYPIFGNAGATAVLVRDGDLLMVRSIATDAATARGNLDKLMPEIRAKIIGN